MRRLILVLGMVLLVPVVLMCMFEFVALDESYHQTLYERFDAVETTGLTQDGIERVGAALVSYLKGHRSDLMMTESVYGIEEQVFGADEMTHMVDVYRLFDQGRMIRNGLTIAAMLLIGTGIWLAKSGRILFCALRDAVLAWIVGLAVSIGWVALDFNHAFIRFHELLFQNELWLMDDSQLMIRMLPEAFFMDVAQRSAWAMAIALIVLLTIGIVGAKSKH